MNKPQKWSEKENSREKMCFFFFCIILVCTNYQSVLSGGGNVDCKWGQ